MKPSRLVIAAGLIGLLASLAVGVAEGLLHGPVTHYDAASPYAFMLEHGPQRLAAGHFLAVLAAPLWLIGYWHVYKMLTPHGDKPLAAALCLLACYGFIVGTVWIGSRAMIAAIVQWQAQTALPADPLVADYRYYMESLLTVIRATTLLFSAGFVLLVLRGDTLYPRWMAFFNPFALLLLVFASYFVVPAVGVYAMPIAMNVAQGLFFAASLYCACRSRRATA